MLSKNWLLCASRVVFGSVEPNNVNIAKLQNPHNPRTTMPDPTLSVRRATRSATVGSKAGKAAAGKAKVTAGCCVSVDDAEAILQKHVGSCESFTCTVCLSAVSLCSEGYHIINKRRFGCRTCVRDSGFMPMGPVMTTTLSPLIPQEAAVMTVIAAEEAAKQAPGPDIKCVCGKSWKGAWSKLHLFSEHIERCPFALECRMREMGVNERVLFLKTMMSPAAGDAEVPSTPPRPRHRRSVASRLSFGGDFRSPLDSPLPRHRVPPAHSRSAE